MTIDAWIKSKIISSTNVTQYTTKVYPEFIPQNKIPPAITYVNTGFARNMLERNAVFSIRSFHNSKALVESMNDALYDLFDTSTSYIRESSSNLYIDSVMIINNIGLYDDENKYWQKMLDVSIWYHRG